MAWVFHCSTKLMYWRNMLLFCLWSDFLPTKGFVSITTSCCIDCASHLFKIPITLLHDGLAVEMVILHDYYDMFWMCSTKILFLIADNSIHSQENRQSIHKKLNCLAPTCSNWIYWDRQGKLIASEIWVVCTRHMISFLS